jgi:hypothetical protein
MNQGDGYGQAFLEIRLNAHEELTQNSMKCNVSFSADILYNFSSGTDGGTDRSSNSHGGRNRHKQIVVADISACFPVQDGLSLCPGAVYAREANNSSIGLVLQSTWRF